jgi:hypothetical protein
MRMASKRLAISICLAGSLSACINLQIYTKAVDGFATATKQAELALSSYNKFDATQTDRLTDIALARVGTVELKNCSVGDDGCSIRVKDKDSKLKPLLPTDNIPNTMVAIKEFSAYAESLKGVLLAEDEEEIAKKLNKVTNTVNGISTLLGGGVVAPFSLVANRLIAFGYDEYLATVKLDALRDATAKVEEKIGDESKFFQAVARFSVELEISDAYRKLDADRDAFYGSPNTAARVKLFNNLKKSADDLANLQKLRSALRDDKTSVFSEMRKSHKTLHDALRLRDQGSISAALKQANLFLEKAKKTAGLVEEIKEARK